MSGEEEEIRWTKYLRRRYQKDFWGIVVVIWRKIRDWNLHGQYRIRIAQFEDFQITKAWLDQAKRGIEIDLETQPTTCVKVVLHPWQKNFLFFDKN